MVKRDTTGFITAELKDLYEKGFNWKLRRLEGPSSPVCKIEGKEMIMLCSNNYLNMSNHPRLKAAAKKAIDSHGAGSGSVRAIAGSMDLHFELEKAIARFKHTEAATYYQTGFAANAGLIPQLVGEGDFILSDELNHGSIIDGVRLTKAERGIFKHSDMADYERAIKEADKKNYRRILVITDGIFSMDGDMAQMDVIVKIAKEYGAMTYVDDAHGEAVVGPDGRGIGAHYNISGQIDVEMGTFSKGFGVVGGLVAGSKDLCEYAYQKSRTYLLSGSAPPATAAACIESIKVLESEPQHVKKLWENTKYFKKEMIGMGFNCGNSVSPITPVICGESHKAKALSDKMAEDGIFALPIVFPMVARDKARIRTMMNAGLEKEHLTKALASFEKRGKELKII